MCMDNKLPKRPDGVQMASELISQPPQQVEGVVLSLKTEEAARGCLRLLTTPILPGLMITALALLRLLAYI